jgi:sec-independent protein translocase protein TatA
MQFWKMINRPLKGSDTMLPHLGPTELIIILVIVIILFGVGRVGRIGGELGSAIREFRRGVQGGEDAGKAEDDKAKNDE